MKELGKDASLHESAVQKIAKGEVDPPKRVRVKHDRHVAKTTKDIKVDKRVMAEAKRLAKDKYVIVIESDTSVLVTNTLRRKG